MKKIYLIPLLLIILAFFSVDLIAQERQENSVGHEVPLLTNRAGTHIYTTNSTEVIGSPLLKNEFKNGRVLFKPNSQSEITPINFDLQKNQILFKKNGQTLVLDKKDIKGFFFEIPQDFTSSEEIQEVYSFQHNNKEFGFTETTPVQVLYNQNSGLQLLAVHEVKLIKGNRKDPFTGKVTDRYVSDTEYFLQTPDHNMHKLRRLRAKDIIKAIDNSKDELHSFIKQNDLDEKSEKDLVRLLSYYDKNIAGNL